MFDYLTKISIINLKEFIVESINHLGWESDLFTRPQGFFKSCLEVSMNTNQWERLSWKTIYSMILTNNNTNGVSSQLFECGRAKLGPLGKRHLHHLLFITELLLVWPVGHRDPNITDWATKPSQVPWNGNLATWMQCLKVRLPSSKKISFYLLQWKKTFKNDEKCFLFHVKSSFRPQDI